MNIDWSKAPEGATHYGAATYSKDGSPDWCEAFYKSMRGRWLICFPSSNDWHGDAAKNRDWSERFAMLIPRPSAWNGEGLPPVGTVCELRAHKFNEWGRAVIKFASRNVVVWDWEGEPEISGLCTRYAHEVEMRPIRTPEQIAAEEREAGIENLLDWVAAQTKVDRAEVYKKNWAVLYDAGLRPPVQP